METKLVCFTNHNNDTIWVNPHKLTMIVSSRDNKSSALYFGDWFYTVKETVDIAKTKIEAGLNCHLE